MNKTLVIVESPTKAKTISKFLGKGYVVESSFGHVRDLPQKKMGVDLKSGTFEPTYEVATEKKATVKKLQTLAKECSDIIFATDEDREGEAISWHLATLLKIKPKDAKRIVFHEITKSAIEHAIANPRHIFQDLVDAQQARRILDRLVGYELSPLLWKKISRGLSAGRVQSVAVRLVVEREREIQAFITQDYWTIDALLSPKKDLDAKLLSRLHSISGKRLDKLALGKETQVETILTDLKGATYTVSSIDEREAKRIPPPAFTTSTLQQHANHKLGYSSKQSMRLAQQLYEGVDLGVDGSVGLITYMRTDSVNLSDQFIDAAVQYIKNAHGDNYLVANARKYKTKSKGAQEAHEAIRPTDPNRTPASIRAFVTPQQHKLYELVWKRAVATQMAAAVLNKTTITIEAGKYSFRTSGQTMQFPGWLALYPETVKEETLPMIKEGEVLHFHELKPEKHTTEPPARYSDATLVKVLEEHGIGRPSTYAPTIATIEAREYVERDDNKRLKPLDVAFLVTDLLVEHFPSIVDYGFTAQVEGEFDEIAAGKHNWKDMIKKFYEPFHKTLKDKEEHLSRQEVTSARELGIDPKTNKPISVRLGRFGPFVQRGTKDDEEKPTFASLPKGMSIDDVTLENALTYLSLPRVVGKNEEGHDILVSNGRYGPYATIDKKNFPLTGADPYTITLEDVLTRIHNKETEQAQKEIKVFENETIKVLNGLYGPYITDGKKNAKIPKDKEPSELTLEECKDLIEKAPEKKKRRMVRKKSK